MTKYKKTLCRLCRKTISDKEFKVIDGATRNILDDLLLNLEFYGDSEVICNYCRRKLNAAVEFKSNCLNINSIIISHVDRETMLQLDLREVYIKENGMDITGISNNDKICRLCMQRIKGKFRDIGEEELQAIEKFAPEMNIMIIKDPVICRPCFGSLYTHSNFLKDCLEVDQKISHIFESSTNNCKTYASSDLLFKTEDLKREDFKINDIEMAIKTECIDIKAEEDERSDTMPLLPTNETIKDNDCEGPEIQEMWKYKNESIGNSSMNARKDSFTLHQFRDDLLYKCNKCTYETKSKIHFTGHCMKHENIPEVYKCETCAYETKQKRLLKSHRLRHKDLSEVQKIYRCNDCDFKTKYKNSIKYHVLRHRNLSQVQTYKCNSCDFEYRHKDSYINHQLIHKDPSEVRMYTCKDCGYETKYKSNVRYHLLRHRDPSQVKMYKCDACDYESRHKRNFTRHQLTHKDHSDVQMYSCNDCDYKTVYKCSIKRHVLIHKDPLLTDKDHSDVQMYSCNDCDYKTMYKRNIARHVLIHRDPL